MIAAIPLLAEGGGRNAYPWLARILLVDVAPQTQLQRLMARDGIDAELAERMISAQASRDARLAIADDVLRNENSLETLQQHIVRLDALYRRLAH